MWHADWMQIIEIVYLRIMHFPDSQMHALIMRHYYLSKRHNNKDIVFSSF
jgi:hypothetical protein